MSTTTPAVRPTGGITPARPPRPLVRPPLSRLVRAELRKMFDTRAGLWLAASVGILATLATVAVIAFAPDSALTYETFGSAVGIPMNVVLPIIAILSITSEWSQRSGLGTFTMVPHRGRVLAAKIAAIAVVGTVSMLVALGLGALGTLLGAALNGIDPVWNVSVGTFGSIILANLLSMAVGVMLGVLTRSSAAGIVGYFVFSFVVPTLSGVLAAFQDWWRDLQPWLDFQFAQTSLFEGWPDAEGWAHLAVASLPWLVLPLAVGLWIVRRSEVK